MPEIYSLLPFDKVEFWQEIPYAPGYQISSRGNIIHRKKLLVPTVLSKKAFITINTLKGRKFLTIHRLMYHTFVDEEPGFVIHSNGDTLDDRIENLERLPEGVNNTRPENRIHGGTERKVCQLDKITGEVMKIWDTAVEAGEFFEKHPSQISVCCKNGKSTFAGFKWKYADEDLKNSLEWVSVEHNSKTYTVAKEGYVLTKQGAVTRGALDSRGYLRYVGQLVHILIALAFCIVPHKKGNEKLEVNHKDGDGSNNNWENLEWVTRSENQKHSHYVLKKGISSSGIPVISTDSDGNEVRYTSAADAGRKTGITRQRIGKFCLGRIKPEKNLKWRFERED